MSKFFFLPVMIAFLTCLTVGAQVTPSTGYRRANYYFYNGDSSRWELRGTNIPTFDTSGKKIAELSISTDRNDTGSNTIFYYSGTVPDSAIGLVNINGKYEPKSWVYYKYSLGKLNLITTYSFNYTYPNIKDEIRDTLIYDSSGLLIKSMEMPSNGLVPTQIYTYSHDSAGNINYAFIEYWDGNMKYSYGRQFYYRYNNKLREIYTEKKQGNEWVAYSKILYDSTFLTSGIEKEEQFPISLYPNPFHSSIKIQNTSFNGNLIVSIMNIMGRVVLQQTTTSEILIQGYTLHIENIPTGIYIIECYDGKSRQRGKVIKN